MPSSDKAPPIDRVGQLISGRYRISSLLGEGGMGAVYLAEHTLMRKRFALKLLHPDMAENQEVLARFRREAEAAAQVEHPNIVAATDFGQTEDGAFFLVLEYVDGITLRATLAKDGALDVVRALHIARQIALALQRAHGAGIVHRDLKPENVMLVRKNEDPDFVKVLDFGIARLEPPPGASAQLLTQAGMLMGTPQYMSPEQAVGDRATHRADLYALGCVLYEMLTGKVPFSGDLSELLSKHILSPVPSMMERAPSVVVPAPVEAVVRKLLEKDANHRHENARAVVDALDQAALESGLPAPSGGSTSDRISVASLPTAVPVSVVVSAQPSEGTAETVHFHGAATPVAPAAPTALAPPAPAASSARSKVEAAVARAVAIYRADVAPRLTPLFARADVLVGQVAARSKIPKRIFLALVLASAAIFFLVLPVALFARHGSHPTSDAGVALLEAGSTAAPDEIRAAALKGTAALQDLAARFPEDPAVARELAFAYDAAGRSSDALRIVRLMAESDPKNVAPDLMRVVSRAASKSDTSDEAFGLLEGPLGSNGVDALLALADSKDVPASTSAHAQRSLAKPAVRASASPSAAFLIDIRVASTCEERHEILLRSGKQADARASVVLHSLDRHDCGRRRRDDCNPCLRKDDAFARATEAANGGAE